MKYEIKSYWTGRVIFEAEIECSIDASEGIKIGLAVRAAIEKNADLRNADLSGAVLRNAVLRNAVLSGADLRNAVLRNADLSGADLRNADLRNADLRNADLRNADLRNADLSGAVLRSFKADVWMTLTENRHEAAGVATAIREGRVDGSTYTGDCACLVGTIANVRQVNARDLSHDPNRPAEQWFTMIHAGDKPGDDTGGGFAAGLALEWVEEWCLLNGIDCGADVSDPAQSPST